jgi:hypothetical protein
VIEVIVADMGGWREIEVPDGVKLEQLLPVLIEGNVWPKLRLGEATYVNPRHIVAIREESE